MKTLIASALVSVAAFAGAASAMVDPATLPHEVTIYAPNADLSNLSEAQANTIAGIVHSGDSVSEKRAKIRSILQ